MVPELGHYALITALSLLLLTAVVPLWGAGRNDVALMNYARPLTLAAFTLLSLSFLCLTVAFVEDDFSVQYVANNSNTALPLAYKISAVWGGHEGSLLLWVWILSAWSLAVGLCSRSIPLAISSRVLSILAWVGVGFGLFILLTSNPFERYLPSFPQQGADLNPLLQDIGLILHPPMLYMGYVGFAVAFAFAIAALLAGRFDTAWARWTRPWTLAAWAFLTFGIALGSWWAYYELGWGGWWFWDPVENASLLPWLVGTALIHSLLVSEKRGVFRRWTLLLAIAAFSLSLLGTFLVRSGVLTSVHAFAVDPARGLFILLLFVIAVGGSLLLFALRAPQVATRSQFTFSSKEFALLLNNILLVVVAFVVLLGTLYPLILQVLDLGKISVGPPYFNRFVVPLWSALSVLIGLGMIARWKQTSLRWLFIKLWPVALLASVLSVFCLWLLAPFVSIAAILSGFLFFWLLLWVSGDLMNKLCQQPAEGATLMARLRRLPANYYGMLLAHLGVGVMVLGVAFVSLYELSRDVRMAVGDEVEVGNYRFVFTGIDTVPGPNYQSYRGDFEVFYGDDLITRLHPEKRRYSAQGMVMTEAGIDAGLTRDLFVALGEPLANNTWAVRLQVKPFVRWIWFGALLMGIGGLLAAFDKRYRRHRKVVNSAKIALPETRL